MLDMHAISYLLVDVFAEPLVAPDPHEHGLAGEVRGRTLVNTAR
mgnify:CR=1 FL=1